MRYYGEDHIDGLLADLGVSSHHFDDGQRGFSFRFDAPLDMRMNQQALVSAADVVNGYEEQKLADVFYLYGEMKNARKIAAAIVKARSAKAIVTTADLMAAMASVIGKEKEKKDLARLFQALRIEVNHEMDALREMLLAATGHYLPLARRPHGEECDESWQCGGNAETRLLRAGADSLSVGQQQGDCAC